MKFPASLRPGGTIGFVAPSFGCAAEPYRTGFLRAMDKWRQMGYALETGPNCFLQEGVGISGTPASCGRELTEFYCSPSNGCLISCGGGELMCETLPYVDFARVGAAAPKWFMGYSDNTNMTFLLATLCDTASVYGPCASSFGMEPWHKSLKDAMDILTEGRGGARMKDGAGFRVENYDGWERESLKSEEFPLAPYHITEPFCPRGFAGGKETGETLSFGGRLLGGCVDCLINLIGTRYDRVGDFLTRYSQDGIVWFLECCDLNPMSLRRAMWQMEQAGWFRGAKGFLVGRPGCHGQELMGMDQYEAVLGVVGKYNVPVVMDADIGHLPPMMPIVTGSYGKVRAGGGKLVLEMYKR